MVSLLSINVCSNYYGLAFSYGYKNVYAELICPILYMY